MPILFCNISWMKRYRGRWPSDPPRGGGAFPESEGYCGEECNFVPCPDGFVYGHFETGKGQLDRQVRIERLGAKANADYLDGVDVVWTAPRNGRDPRVVVGWSRDARVYRDRQHLAGQAPSPQHTKDKIGSFRVKAKTENVVLLRPSERKLELGRGPGWSGQTSWWYAADTTDPDAIAFVAKVQAAMNSHAAPALQAPQRQRGGSGNGRAGAASSTAYTRYLEKHEVRIRPRHDRLQKRFMAFLRGKHAGVEFQPCFRDDLRYSVPGQQPVMVEVKPSEDESVRYAIRTAIGQLMDYRQDQRWAGPQLIVVESPVQRADDLALALENGFGLAWPGSGKSFVMRWP